MGTFGTYADTPFTIRQEGQEITIKFERTSPTTGKISWDIPSPAAGCTTETQAYDGIIITADTVPATLTTTPVDGTRYTADPTFDPNLFAGDKIGTALVVGAFYDDKTTTSLDVTGLQPNVPYYISGYAVDNVLRHHQEGVHAYSLPFGQPDGIPTSGSTKISFNEGDGGIQGSDATGLDPLVDYNFYINIDGQGTVKSPNGGNTLYYKPTIHGGDAVTYDQLIEELNKALILQVSNPLQSATYPNTGTYYFNPETEELKLWNGTQLISKDVLLAPTDPTIRATGDYWYNTVTDTLNRWNGSSWVAQQVIKFATDPTTPTCETTYWFDGSTAYVWNGAVWIPLTVHNQLTDPSLPPVLDCPFYWNDEETNTLYVRDEQHEEWDETRALKWTVDPTTAPSGTFWFNETDQLVYRWNTPTTSVWNLVAATVAATAPTAPAVNAYWFNTTNNTLNQWNGSAWVDVPIQLWPTNPRVPTPGMLWWNTTTDDMYVWNVLTSAWVLTNNFEISEDDPSAAPTLTTDDVWFSSNTLKRWDGSQWVTVTYIDFATDPTNLSAGVHWLNTTTNEWSIWDGSNWDPIAFVIYAGFNPSTPTSGTYWYDTTNDTLFQWNGIAWVSLMFTTTSPVPITGYTFYNTTLEQLLVWNGTLWVEGTPPATAMLDGDGNIVITSTLTGSMSSIRIIDGDSPNGLFGNLNPTSKIEECVLGTDGVSGQPSYMQLGVGTDGSDDERRNMVHQVLSRLGYPTVEVELTKDQLDFCISNALMNFRRLSVNPYRRVVFFLTIKPGVQHYVLSNKTVGFHKVVNVMGCYRVQSSFLGTGAGQGVYGQVLLQHLFQMGTFDMISYYLVSQYIEELNYMFANDITFNWNETTRVLSMYKTFWQTNSNHKEKILVDCTVERTDQDLIKDRWCANWLLNWATAEAKMILAEIRGKYSSLPGAGGGIVFNADALRTQATEMFQKCEAEVDDYIANSPEEVGMMSQFILG